MFIARGPRPGSSTSRVRWGSPSAPPNASSTISPWLRTPSRSGMVAVTATRCRVIFTCRGHPPLNEFEGGFPTKPPVGGSRPPGLGRSPPQEARSPRPFCTWCEDGSRARRGGAASGDRRAARPRATSTRPSRARVHGGRGPLWCSRIDSPSKAWILRRWVHPLHRFLAPGRWGL